VSTFVNNNSGETHNLGEKVAFLGLYIYKTKKGEKYYLHMSKKGNRTLYYFSKEPAGALPALPMGYEVVENPKTGLPMLRKKSVPGLFDMLTGAKIGTKKEK